VCFSYREAAFYKAASSFLEQFLSYKLDKLNKKQYYCNRYEEVNNLWQK